MPSRALFFFLIFPLLLVAHLSAGAEPKTKPNFCLHTVVAQLLDGPNQEVAIKILSNWGLFSDHARRVSLATLGGPRLNLNRAAMREDILGRYSGPRESEIYSNLFRKMVQKELDDTFLGPAPRNVGKILLDGFALRGVVFVLHQKPEYQQKTAQFLAQHPRMADLARQTFADEESPVGTALSKQISAITYSSQTFDTRLVKVEPILASFQVHLLGGPFDKQMAQELALFLKRIAADEIVQRIEVVVHAPVCYSSDLESWNPNATLRLEVLLARDGDYLKNWSRILARAFGATREVGRDEPILPGTSYDYMRPDHKILSVNIEPKL